MLIIWDNGGEYSDERVYYVQVDDLAMARRAVDWLKEKSDDAGRKGHTLGIVEPVEWFGDEFWNGSALPWREFLCHLRIQHRTQCVQSDIRRYYDAQQKRIKRYVEHHGLSAWHAVLRTEKRAVCAGRPDVDYTPKMAAIFAEVYAGLSPQKRGSSRAVEDAVWHVLRYTCDCDCDADVTTGGTTSVEG